MSHDDDVCNKSKNEPFNKILSKYISRRKVLIGGISAATSGFFADLSLAGNTMLSRSKHKNNVALIAFTPVPISKGTGAMPAISADYEYQVLIPWGDPLRPDGPSYQWPPQAAKQANQIGIGHDGMHYFPLAKGKFNRSANSHGLLVINHEFGRNSHVLGKSMPESLADVRVSQHAHGVSIVEIKKIQGQWRTVKSQLARRVHVNTAVRFSGPAAEHALLQTKSAEQAMGTVNNCANGYTPWGTYLSCEENFNGYFAATNKTSIWRSTEEQLRYGFSEKGFSYGWEKFDPRFDLSNPAYHNEENRFGWVVEIDPFAPNQAPVKRTALGRFKHEGIAITEGRGKRIVGYMGDDQRFDYIYKFVSEDNWQAMRAVGKSPLDYGSLYVARFNADGSGDWLELTIDNPALAKRFKDQAEILVYTRIAADIVGATPMDRPEWITLAANGDVYCTLTNNSKRSSADAANPMAPNHSGHIIRWRDSDAHIGRRFTWDIFLMAKDSHASEHSFSSPDGLWIDPDGRLFIETDGKQEQGLNNQLLVADTHNKQISRLLTSVTGAEITGITSTPDRRTLFVNIQHPGNGDPKLTNFPASLDGESIPRDCTLVIKRKNGGIVGS